VNAAVHGDEEAFFSLPFVSVEEAIGDLPPLNPGEEAIGYSTAPFSDYQGARRRGCRALSNHTARNHEVTFIEKAQKDKGRREQPGLGWPQPL
jgi:hypothetical protein